MLRAISRAPRKLPIRPLVARRFLSTEPKEVFTKLNDTADPARNSFFQYTWGTWMKNNVVEKAKRETRFNIENATTFIRSLKLNDPTVVAPETLGNGITTLTHNWTKDIIGEKDFDIQSIASIHEGKHHRVYKLTLKNGRDLVLRIPYKLESDFSIENKIKSEAATLDFLHLKLDMPVPKVVAYGATRLNPLQTPFILMEHIEGDLLMRNWDPMMADSETTSDKLKEVIDPIMDFSDKALSVVFNRFGSLFFFDDVSIQNQAVLPYDGESKEELKNRWRIGPSVERAYSKNKRHMASYQIKKHTGPWDSDKPQDMVADLAELQLQSLKIRMGLAQADAGNKVEDIEQLNKQIEAFEHFKVMSRKLFNPESKSIMNVEKAFKPRLYFPDLDPLNVIVRDGKPVFIDFEHTVIKPFILSNYPSFVAYHGAKIYNLEEDIPDYKGMDEVEQQQYQFMYYKTRNERLWESSLNEKRHDLIAIASPHVKVLKSPYLQALDCKNDKEYLFVENAIVQLQAMWNVYVTNGLVNETDSKFPISYTQEKLDEHQLDLENYQAEQVSTPFAATGGWVPQDMFVVLKEQGILVEDGEGNFKIETEAALKDPPQEK